MLFSAKTSGQCLFCLISSVCFGSHEKVYMGQTFFSLGQTGLVKNHNIDDKECKNQICLTKKFNFFQILKILSDGNIPGSSAFLF